MSIEPKMKIVPRSPTTFPCNSNHMKFKNTGSERGSEEDKASGLCEGKTSKPCECIGTGKSQQHLQCGKQPTGRA